MNDLQLPIQAILGDNAENRVVFVGTLSEAPSPLSGSATS